MAGTNALIPQTPVTAQGIVPGWPAYGISLALWENGQSMEANEVAKKCLIPLLSILSICGALNVAMAARLQPSDLTYLGAFLLPTTPFFEAMGEMGYPQTSGMTFNPDGNGGKGSLFIIGRGGRVAEINTPRPKLSSLKTATVLQKNPDPFSYGAYGENDATAGIAYMTARGSQTSPKLYFGSFEYYNVDGTDYNSLGWANTTLTDPQTAGLWHVGPRAGDNLDDWNHGVKSGEYLIATPQAWADQHTNGRSLLIGRMREAAGAGGSSGPVLLATAPWRSGNPPAPGTALPATPLMYFYTNITVPSGTSTKWQSWRMNNDPDWSYWSPMDRCTGGAWIDRNGRSALVLGLRHGTFKNDPIQPKYGRNGAHGGFKDDPSGRTPAYCYGDASQCLATSNNNYRGYSAGPYVARLAFVDIADLEAVAAGSKDPRTVIAYNVYNLMNDFGKPAGTRQDRTDGNDVIGIAYNEKTGRLYVGQANGNDPNGHPNPAWPVIHVYRINRSDSSHSAQP